MDFTPDETQEAVAEVATALLARELEPDALWAAFAEADLLTLALPERLGGEGLSVTDVGSLLVDVGRAAAPIPALATLGFGVLPIVALGTDAQQDELLTGVSAGRVFTAALGEPGQQFPAQPSTTAHQSGDWYRVSGTVLAVPFAASAHRILVPTDAGVVLVDPTAAAVRQAETLVALKPRKATAGTFRRPDPKPTIGLAEPLAARIEHRRPIDAKGETI